MNKKQTLSRLIKALGGHLPLLILSLLLAAVHTVLSLLIPLYAGDAIDLMVGKGIVATGLVEILSKILIMTLCAAIIGFIMNSVNNMTAARVCRDIRKKAFEKLQKLPLSYHDSHRSGDTLSMITADTEQISDGLLLGFTQLFTGIATIAGTLYLMFRINIAVALAVFVLTPVSLLVSRFIASKSYRYFKDQTSDRAKQTSTVNETVTALKTVKSLGAANEIGAKFEIQNENLRNSSFKAVFYSSLTNPVTRFVNSLVYAAVALFGAITAMTTGGVTVGALTCLLSYANKYTKPFNEISGVIAELQGALAAASRIFTFLDEKEEDVQQAELKLSSGGVEMKNVSFSYLPERPLIKDLSFEVKPGMRVAIVGPTGCGKTTLINLLMRFYDVKGGAVYVDGQDIRTVKRQSLRGVYGMVLQESWVRRGTVYDNITLRDENISKEDAVIAAKKAHAHSFIKQLPMGYDTVIDEGYGLSEGQKQLICIARAIASDPELLVLDEATSSIDTLTEKRVQRAFDELMQGRTSFIVAHRLSTITDADLILVMKDGDIIEKGKHDELLSQKGFYYQLHNSRYGVTDTA